MTSLRDIESPAKVKLTRDTRRGQLACLLMGLLAGTASAAEKHESSPLAGLPAACEVTELQYMIHVVKESTFRAAPEVRPLLSTTLRTLPGHVLPLHTKVTSPWPSDIELVLTPACDGEQVTVTAKVSDEKDSASVTEALRLPLGDGRLVRVGPFTVQVTRMPIDTNR